MQPGTTIGPYEVCRHLGDGGMGSVWLAEDTRLHRRVALKTLHAAKNTDHAGRERLRREARAAAAINHPSIATVYDVLEIGDDVVIVFEFVDGHTLAEEIGRTLTVERVLAIGSQLARALAAAHSQGVIHRDLKPSNVMVGPEGDIKVLDFGVARLLPMGTTMIGGETATAGGFAGTPAYAAPEQLLSSAVDERADLYALGVMLFEMATGRRPFAGHDPVALAAAKLAAPAPAVSSTGSSVPPAFSELVARLLERQAADRPGSAAEVLGALRAISGEPSTRSLPRAERPWRWIAAAATLLIMITAAVVTIGLPKGTADAVSAPTVVAVMPLRNTSSDASQDFLAAGLAESLIANLAASKALTVLSRSAIAEGLTNGSNNAQAADALGANVVVEGSLQRSGEQLRVNINVIKGDRTVWGGTFDGTAERVFDLQTRMALAVAEVLAAGGTPKPATSPTTKPAALEAYWRGRAFLDRWDVKGNIDAAISALREAVADDPAFALGHAGLGQALWQKYTDTREQQYARLAIESGSNAAQLDPDRPEVLFALAVSLNGTGRRDEAVTMLRKALTLRPTYDEARRKLGEILAIQGNVDEAIGEFDRAIALRPKYWGAFSEKGIALLNAGRYEDATHAFQQVVALQPDNQMGFQQLGATYQMLGEPQRALEAYEKALAIRPSYGAYSNVGMIEHSRGRYEQAVAAYRRAIELRPNVASAHRNLGDAFARLGRTRDANAAYEKAVERARADLTVNPSNARNLAALAVYLAKARRPAEAVAEATHALTAAPNDMQVRFRAAVAYTLANNTAAALEHIKIALKQGYSVRAVRDEEDFQSLRNTPGFIELTGPR